MPLCPFGFLPNWSWGITQKQTSYGKNCKNKSITLAAPLFILLAHSFGGASGYTAHDLGRLRQPLLLLLLFWASIVVSLLVLLPCQILLLRTSCSHDWHLWSGGLHLPTFTFSYVSHMANQPSLVLWSSYAQPLSIGLVSSHWLDNSLFSERVLPLARARYGSWQCWSFLSFLSSANVRFCFSALVCASCNLVTCSSTHCSTHVSSPSTACSAWISLVIQVLGRTIGDTVRNQCWNWRIELPTPILPDAQTTSRIFSRISSCINSSWRVWLNQSSCPLPFRFQASVHLFSSVYALRNSEITANSRLLHWTEYKDAGVLRSTETTSPTNFSNCGSFLILACYSHRVFAKNVCQHQHVLETTVVLF